MLIYKKRGVRLRMKCGNRKNEAKKATGMAHEMGRENYSTFPMKPYEYERPWSISKGDWPHRGHFLLLV